jgi:hypothetical protein
VLARNISVCSGKAKNQHVFTDIDTTARPPQWNKEAKVFRPRSGVDAVEVDGDEVNPMGTADDPLIDCGEMLRCDLKAQRTVTIASRCYEGIYDMTGSNEQRAIEIHKERTGAVEWGFGNVGIAKEYCDD